MGDRAAQICAEWFVKCASVVLQARVPSRPPTAAAGKDRRNRWVRPRVSRAPTPFGRVFQKANTNALFSSHANPKTRRFLFPERDRVARALRTRRRPSSRPPRARLTARAASDPQFNLETEERASLAEALRSGLRAAARASPQPRSRRVVLEIFLEFEREGEKRERVSVERWVFEHNEARPNDAEGPCGVSPAVSVPAAYKQLVVFFRTLHAELRALPAHRYARAAAGRLLEDVDRVEDGCGVTARGGFAFAFAIRRESESAAGGKTEVSKPPPLERADRGTTRAASPGRDSGTTLSSETSASPGSSGVSSSVSTASSDVPHFSVGSGGSRELDADDGDAPEKTVTRRRSSLPRVGRASGARARATRALASAPAPGGGRLDASVHFLDADALRELDLGDAPFGTLGAKAREATPERFRDAPRGRRGVSSRSGSATGSDGRAEASPGGSSDSENKRDGVAEQRRPRRTRSWKARATQFLATSPGSAKIGFAARPEADDVDTPPPPNRIGIVLAGAGADGISPSGGSRGLLSAEMARYRPDRVGTASGVIHPSSSFVGSQETPFCGTPASGPSTPSSSSRPPLAPASTPVSGPTPIFGFAEAEGFQSASPAGAGSGRGSSGGGFLSALASRLASSPGMAIPGMGTLPFALGSSGSRGSGASLASPAHALAARAADSPPWHFRGLMVPSGSPGATTPWRVDRHPNTVGASVSRRASWSSPSSSLSVSFQESAGAAANRVPGGPFAYGTSPRCAALGSSPEILAGTGASALRARPVAPGGDVGDAARAAVSGEGPDPREGPRRRAAAFAAESADDALPFELDVEDDDDGSRDGASGVSVGVGGETSVDGKASVSGRVGIDAFDADAAVAALVRALREAPPLGLEPGSGGAPARGMTLAGAKRRLASIRRETVVARRHRGGASSSGASSRASSEAEKRDAPRRRSSPGFAGAPALGDERKNEASRVDDAAPPTAASISVDAAVDEALAFAEPAGGR